VIDLRGRVEAVYRVLSAVVAQDVIVGVAEVTVGLISKKRNPQEAKLFVTGLRFDG
jgi:hypothetical protein